MASIVPGYEYDIFISYRHNDNLDGWVSGFVQNLEKELKGTIKEPVSIYFDTNPHDGLLETHDVDGSLKEKIKCRIFIPIVSQTYCDTNAFAWQNEFIPFLDFCKEDFTGLEVKLPGGNISKRVLPIRIHDIDVADKKLFESEIKGVMRPIDFIFKASGVNRPLTSFDKREENSNKTVYRDQINKVANAINEILKGIKENVSPTEIDISEESPVAQSVKLPFSKKLTRRNILRASLTYILTALLFWKILLVSSNLLHLTENTIQLITFVLMLLFPFAMLMAWLFERSPKGFIRTGSVASLVNPFPDAKKKPFTSNTFISILLVTTVALFLVFPPSKLTKSTDRSKNIVKSIAVLPFDNLSNDPEQEYFSDGMVEEILDRLFKIGDLKVISRTSSMRYKNTSLSLKEIAGELGVTTVLEGSVRKVGNNVRITVQLIDSKTDNHLWSQIYDKDLSDILQVQSDIAIRIAEELKAVLSTKERTEIETSHTINPEAHNLYLQGRYFWYKRTKKDLERSVAYFEKSIAQDTSYAIAYAGLADAYYIQIVNHYYDPFPGGFSRPKELILKAIELDNNLAEAHTTLGNILYFSEMNWEEAKKEFKLAIKLNPDYADAYYFYSQLLDVLRQKKEAREQINQALKLDPFQSNYHFWSGFFYYNEGNFTESVNELLKVQELNPNNRMSHILCFYNYIRLGANNKALVSYKEYLRRTMDTLSMNYIHTIDEVFNSSGITGLLKWMIDERLKDSKPDPYNNLNVATYYSILDKKGPALDWLEKASENPTLEFFRINSSFYFNNLRSEPRFQAIIKKLGLSEYQ